MSSWDPPNVSDVLGCVLLTDFLLTKLFYSSVEMELEKNVIVMQIILGNSNTMKFCLVDI